MGNQKATIENLVPSVKCDADVITVSMSRCLLTTLGYDYTSISINGNSSNLCNYVYEDHVNGTVFENIQTQLKEGFCGNNVTKNSSIYILSNNVHISPIQVGNIITKNPVSLNFNCTYDLTKQVSVNYTLHPISQTIYLPGVNGTGSYPLTMSAYKDPEYITQLQETDNVPIGELVYVSLNVLAVDGDLFALRTVQCVASGTDSRTGGVNLLAGGCKVDNSDIYVNVSENGVSLESRFSFSMFQFQDQTQLYLFCDVLLCDKTANCSRGPSTRSEVVVAALVLGGEIEEAP
ncbi:pancreatic secretory granule membrane major glycoprotein GP2-like [Hyperolius riggenbachi]|uniref:pancreatic secretory granule membrane major glycoprotein GP2-like n=1 Tax=Hyperolius riggenbachi TaxID=752182 RepID=UPI0035A33826